MSTPPTSSDADPSVPADPLSLISEAGRLGISLAGRIASEFARGSVPIVNATLPSSDAAGSPTMGPDLRAALRSAQLDVERAVDGALDVLGQAVDSYADLADRATSADADSADAAPESLVIHVAAGLSTEGQLWIHNTTEMAAASLRPQVTSLVAHDSFVLDGEVTIEPGAVSVVPAAGSAALVVRVTTTTSTRPGAYHGLVLVEGLPDAVVHLRVEVETAAA